MQKSLLDDDDPSAAKAISLSAKGSFLGRVRRFWTSWMKFSMVGAYLHCHGISRPNHTLVHHHTTLAQPHCVR